MTALAALVADVERDLAAGLAKLSAAVADGTFEDAERQLNGSANHVACALNRLAHIETPSRPVAVPEGWAAAAGTVQAPVRRDPEAARRASAIATTGGPVNVPGESLSPGCGNGRVGGAPGAATFSLPEPPFVIGVGVPYDALPPVDSRPYRERLGLARFGEGEDRLVGSVEFTAGSAMYRGAR